MLVSIFSLIGLYRLRVADIALLEKILSINIVHLVFVSCDYFYFVGIFSMPFIVFLQFNPYGLGVTI